MSVNAYLINSNGEPVAVNKLNVTTVTKQLGCLVTVWFNNGSFCELKGNYNEIVKSLETSEDDRNRETKRQYKRDMVSQLVNNNALTEIIQSEYKSDTTGEFHNVIGTMAEKLTEEAFK